MTAPDDAAVRARALDPGRSFVVQAPAGSGKTTLLTQRLLGLLVTVAEPEQVVAITFTRKAAEEMRARIVSALGLARGAAPDDPFQRTTWALARAVLAHDERHGWQLALQPARLRLMTIDALCQHLVRQLPLTAGLAGPRNLLEDATPLYLDSARAALAEIADRGPWQPALRRALLHFDNDWTRLESLIADMLARRDQWLRVFGPGSERAALEASFAEVVAQALGEARARLAPFAGALCAAADHAGGNLAREDPSAPLAVLAGLRALPAAVLPALPLWQALAGLLLTAGGEWRRTFNKNQGFPAGKGAAAERKAQALALIDALAGDARLLAALRRIQRLPAALYDGAEWDVVLALIEVLKRATAHLMVESGSGGRVDFTAYALAARTALGPPEAPTDLALRIDHRIQHLLIDEFQDTSIAQFDLIQRLTAGWTGEDGRTLFLVGDPMQSIYRFRQADPQLFTDVIASARLGSVTLERLILTVNFRAQAGLVDWINEIMPGVLAALEGGAMPFVPQVAARAASGTPVVLYPQASPGHGPEAAEVVAVVRAIRAAEPDASIAVLVRSRSHLGGITSALLAQGLAVAAREIRPLAAVPAIADLCALTRALLHPADRVAWLAVLRAPWCGLRLVSLTALAAHDGVVLEALADGALQAALAPDEAARLARCGEILRAAWERRAELPLPVLVEETWLALGGAAALAADPIEAEVRAFFALLEELAAESSAPGAERMEELLAARYSKPPPAPVEAVQIMTMHRAKGLEFDHVIVPGLGRRPQADGARLLLWRETLNADGTASLLVAPHAARGHSALYDFLRAEERLETAAEAARLLYVAITRARRRLHLLGHATSKADGTVAPAAGSFLALLWDALADDYRPAPAPALPPAGADDAPTAGHPLRRWRLPARPAGAVGAGQPPALPAVEFAWASVTAKHVGTVTHRLLQRVAGLAPAMPDAAWLARAGRWAGGQLRALGVAPDELDAAVVQVARALSGTLASARGRWLFADTHREVRSEWHLALRRDDGVQHLVIDRSFVDSDGVRWIVDFKTGTHGGGGREAWLDAEVERYSPQLERYAQAVVMRDSRPVRLGLYFPLLDGWREWGYAVPGR